MRITAGQFKNSLLFTPKGKETRPTTEKFRQTVFNLLQDCIEESFFLDLFAGSGAMGLEALSRGAKWAVFVEKDREALRAIAQNIEKLQVGRQTELIGAHITYALKKLSKRGTLFTIIYADPPYRTSLYATTLKLLDTLPLLAPQGVLLIEEGKEAKEKKLPELQTLRFKEKRKIGGSFLFLYQKK